MPKYRKKPLVVDAEVYREGLEDYVLYFIPMFGLFTKEECIEAGFTPDFEKDKIPYIESRNGREQISPGDYVVTGEDGSKHVLNPQLFHQLYEIVPESRLRKVDEFAIRYHYETEKYDREFPHSLNEDGFACVNPDYRGRCNYNAHKVRSQYALACREHQISLEEYEKAIQYYSQFSFKKLEELYHEVTGA